MFDYNKKRYWYHLSDTLTKDKIKIIPEERLGRRDYEEPSGKRFCVAPSIAHCLIAICSSCIGNVNIYRSQRMVLAKKPRKVFDAHITNEGWITRPINFIKIGNINLYDYPTKYLYCASTDNFDKTKEALNYFMKNLNYE